jgi:hypothetical protein
VPEALFETNDTKPGFGQSPGHDTAGGAGADDEDICGFGGQD